MEDENVEIYDVEYIYKSAKNVIFGLESKLSNDMKVSKLIKLVDELPEPKDPKYLFSIFEDVIYIPVRNACVKPVIELDKDTTESLLIRLVDELIVTKDVEYIYKVAEEIIYPSVNKFDKNIEELLLNKLTEALIATKDVQYICTLAVIIIKDRINVSVFDNCITGSLFNRLDKDIRFQLLNKLTEALIATRDIPCICKFAEIIIKDGPLRDTDHLDEDIRVLKVSILNRLVSIVLESKDTRYIYFLAALLKCGLRTSGLDTDIKPLLYKSVTGLISTRNAAYIYFFAIIIYFFGDFILDKNMYFSEFPEELFYEIYDYVNDECTDEKEKNEKERILSFMISDLQVENNIEEKILACMMSYQLNNNIGDQTKVEFYFRRFLANYNSNSATKLEGIISNATNSLLVTIFKKEVENLSVINPFLGAILNEKVDEKLREFKKNNLYDEDGPNMGGR